MPGDCSVRLPEVESEVHAVALSLGEELGRRRQRQIATDLRMHSQRTSAAASKDRCLKKTKSQNLASPAETLSRFLLQALYPEKACSRL